MSKSIRFQLWVEQTEGGSCQHRSFRRGTVTFCGVVIPSTWMATQELRKPSNQCPECEHVFRKLFGTCETCGRER